MSPEPIVLIVTITPTEADHGTPELWRDHVAEEVRRLDADAITVDLLTFPAHA